MTMYPAMSFGQGPVTPPATTAAPSAPEAPALPKPDPLDGTHEVPATSEKVERIEVTGSHIRRVDTEGTSPVTTVTRKEIEKTGYNSVSDVLRDISVNSFGSTRESSGGNAAGNATVDLRGLGATNTLVLLNGQRLPADAVTGSVDLNLIPLAAVERVEVLKDGASAIYGSDALGGVVNIITRKDFKGTQVSVTESLPDKKGGEKTEVSLVNGVNAGSVNVVTVMQFRDNKTIYSRDRPWTAFNYSDNGNPGSYSSKGDPIVTNRNWHPDPNCPPGLVNTVGPNQYCRINTGDFSTQLPNLQQFSLLSEATWDVSSAVKLTARVGGTHRDVKWAYAPAPGTFEIDDRAAADAQGLPFHTPGSTSPSTPLLIRYRLLELGNRQSNVVGNAYNALLGSQVQLGGDWQLNLSFSQNQVFQSIRDVHGYALTDALQNLVSSGAYKPFAVGNKGDLSSAKYVPGEDTLSNLTSLDAQVAGPIVEMPAGPLNVALGANVTGQRYADVTDDQSLAGNVFGSAGSNGGGHRVLEAVYAEFSIPVVKQVELQLAGRYDHYSDFGSTVNPKAALLYHVTPTLLIRGSVGTGFKAPLMQDLYASQGSGYQTFIDHVACNAEKAAGGKTPSCLPAQYLVTSGGNTGLKQETSLSFNAGAVFEPVPEFNISGDWFLTKLTNVVGIDYDDMALAESRTTNPATVAPNWTSGGVTVHRDANGYIDTQTGVDAPLQNLSTQKVQGLDLSASYKFLNMFKLSDDHSALFYFDEEGFPGAGLRDKLGENGRPGWRNTAALGFTPADQHELTLVAMTIAGQEKAVKELGNLPHYTQLDFLYAYDAKQWGQFSLGIKNLLGTTPPLDDSSPTSPLNTSLYDQIGRQYVLGYKKTF